MAVPNRVGALIASMSEARLAMSRFHPLWIVIRSVCGPTLGIFDAGTNQDIISRMARQLSSSEKGLIRWMLEHGHPEARSFLPQLELASVTDWRCPCGCASINLEIAGVCQRRGGLHILADFVFGDSANLSGVFVYETLGFLAGLEVYGLTGDAPTVLPHPDALRPFEAS